MIQPESVPGWLNSEAINKFRLFRPYSKECSFDSIISNANEWQEIQHEIRKEKNPQLVKKFLTRLSYETAGTVTRCWNIIKYLLITYDIHVIINRYNEYGIQGLWAIEAYHKAMVNNFSYKFDKEAK